VLEYCLECSLLYSTVLEYVLVRTIGSQYGTSTILWRVQVGGIRFRLGLQYIARDLFMVRGLDFGSNESTMSLLSLLI